MILQEDQILGLIEPVVTIKRKTAGKYVKTSEANEYFPNYLEYNKWREAISIHTVKGKKPVEMLSVKAPCQSDEELAYVLANYKQITLPINFEFLSTIGRGLHDSNWSIEFQDERPEYVNSEMTYKKYLDEDMARTPIRMSYDAWMKFVLPQIKINDSMGVVAYKPYRQEVTVVNEQGEAVIAGDYLPEPIPIYYSSDKVLSSLDSGYLLAESSERSIVEYNGKKTREGLVFELYDDQNIWIIEQVGKKQDYTFSARLYFEHNIGILPASYLMGSAVYMPDGTLAYQSPFLMVTDILDEVAIDGTMLRSVKASSVYMQKAMIGNDCAFEDPKTHFKCVNGFVQNDKLDGYHKCPECFGTGMKSRTSPLNTIYVKPRTQLDQGDEIKPSDAVAYISPPVDVPKFLREEITEGLMSAMQILHLKATNQQGNPTAADNTATGMVLDEKGKYAFIKTVVDQIFELYEFGLMCMGKMRYGADFVKPHVNRPMSYDFNTESDYLNIITTIQAAGAPPAIISSYIYKYLQAMFYDNPRTARSYDLIIAADRLFAMSKEQIAAEQQRGLVQGWEVVLHDSALSFVADLIREDDRFLDQEMDVMIEQLKNKAREATPAPTSTGARLNVGNIIANANA